MIVIFVGPPDSAARLAIGARQHAAWLGRPLDELQHSVSAALVAFAAWDPATVDDANRYLTICAADPECTYHDRLGGAADRASFHLTLQAARLEVAVALAAPVPALRFSVPGGGLAFTDDLRVVRRMLDPRLLPIGVQGLLKWGAPPAPLTMFEGVERVVPGTAVRYEAESGRTSILHPWRDRVAALAETAPPATVEEAGEVLIGALHRAVTVAPPSSAVAFSAGVDSPLLALRLAESGAVDTRLVHMSFANAPAETVAARAIAGHLDLPLDVIDFDPHWAPRLLDAAGLGWPQPVGSSSIIAGHQVVRRALDLGAQAIVDGSSGGTADTRRILWQKATRVPPPAAAAAAWLYRTLGLWTGQPSRLERALRAVARAHRLTMPAAGLTQNSLDGIAYDLPAASLRELAAAIATQAADLPEGAASAAGFVVAAAAHQGAARWSANAMPAWQVGRPVVLPSLSEGVVAAKLLVMRSATVAGSGKAVQRQELLRRLPPELVNRPKHAFMSPIHEVLANPELRAAVEGAVAPGAPLHDFVRPPAVRRLLALAAAGRPIGEKQAGLLWTIACADAWLRATAPGRAAR